MSNEHDRVSADLKAYEHAQDLAACKDILAEELACRAFAEGRFDSSDVRGALGNRDAAWWLKFETCLTKDPAQAGHMLAEAVKEKLSDDFFCEEV